MGIRTYHRFLGPGGSQSPALSRRNFGPEKLSQCKLVLKPDVIRGKDPKMARTQAGKITKKGGKICF